MSWGPAYWASLGEHGEELPGLGRLGEDSGCPSICPRAFANKEGRPAGGGLLEDPGTAHPGEVQAGGGGRQ